MAWSVLCLYSPTKWFIFHVSCLYQDIETVFSSLQKIVHSNVSYIDDSLLKGDTKEDCAENI